jgi:signal transduction histidine kinase
VSYEVTEIKRLLDELQRANYLNAILLDSIPHPALLVSKSRTVIAANKLAKDAGAIVGGFCWKDFGHCLYLNDEDMKCFEANDTNNDKVIACNFCQADNALEEHECSNIEMKLEGIDWDIYWIPTHEDGIYLHYAIDITERKKIEKSLRESELRFKILAEASFEGICIHVNGKILDCNTRMAELFGYDEEALSGMSLCDIIPTNSGCRIFSGSNLGIKKNGAVFDIKVLTRKIKYNGIDAEVLVVRDNTEAKLLQETLEMDRLKTEFFANVSHELRTPLNIIFSALQLQELYLGNGSIEDRDNRISKGVKSMKHNCYRLMRLINNLIDMTKIDGDFISLHPENTDIVRMVNQICSSVAEYIKGKDINLTFNTNVHEKVIACDPDKIETIMLNLISNAVKFNRPGGSIAVNICDEEDSILITVEDTGIGIPEEKQEDIFKRFVQVDKSLNRSHEGSGIGLSLVKSYVEMHGGQIGLESKSGAGCKFEVRLPCRILKPIKSEDKRSCCHRKEQNDYIERVNLEFSDIYME